MTSAVLPCATFPARYGMSYESAVDNRLGRMKLSRLRPPEVKSRWVR